MEQINKLSRRPLTPEEVFVFSVSLCDNEMDRDFERFGCDALEKLAPLIIGKPGIFDHSMKSADQTARIFSARIEKDEKRRTSFGEIYHFLKARAYMLRTEKNADLIMEIDAGIKKEVSIGCAMGKINCSVCGADLKAAPCKHRKGKTYDGKRCHAVLSEPLDAYEWSFVAVPAQPAAGVTKAYSGLSKQGGEHSMTDIRKMLETEEEEITFSPADVKALRAFISDMEADASAGQEYRKDLQMEVTRLCGISLPEINLATFKGVVGRLSLDELKSFKKSFESKLHDIIPPSLQLSGGKDGSAKKDNSSFKI